MSATPRRLSNAELAARATRRAHLDDPAYDGDISDEDLSVMSPHTVVKLMNAGRLSHLGVPPQRAHGRSQ